MGYNTEVHHSKMGWKSTMPAWATVKLTVMSQIPVKTLYAQFLNSCERHLMWLLFL